MPTYVLKIKADLENINKLRPTENNVWMLNVKSPSEEIRERITFSSASILQLDGSKGIIIVSFILY